jgi:hypothetical protein
MADPAAPDPPPRRKRRGPWPVQRTLQLLRRQGHLCAAVERYNSFAKVRQDLFKWVDIVTLPPPPATSVTGLQICSMSDHAARATKMLSPAVLPNVLRWLQAGGHAAIVAWTRHQSKLRKTARWSATRFALRLTDEGGVEWLPPELLSGPRRLRSGTPRRGRRNPTALAKVGTRYTAAAPTSPQSTADSRGRARGRDTRVGPASTWACDQWLADTARAWGRADWRSTWRDPAPWRALVGWPGGASG